MKSLLSTSDQLMGDSEVMPGTQVFPVVVETGI
jgi:hypothetical protein